MSRRKHHFPVSHDINDDPLLWKVTDELGVCGLRMFLEVLSILDKTGNYLLDTEAQWRGIARKCRTRQLRAYLLRNTLVNVGYLRTICCTKDDQNPYLGSPNYWKYHSKECRESDFTWPLKGFSEPNHIDSSYKNTQNPEPAAPEPSVDLKKKKPSESWSSELKLEVDRLFESDRKKYQRLVIWVQQAFQAGYSDHVIRTTVERFWPYQGHVDGWWPYLDRLIVKTKADLSRDLSLVEHEGHKLDVVELSKFMKNR